MKVLTIKQPWASLIINKYKTFEFRSWKTNYRGKILIHAGLSFDKEYLKILDVYKISYVKGAIIGEAEIIDCIFVDDEFNRKLKKINSRVYNHDYVGLYAWKLNNIIIYDSPIYIKGKLGLWNYEEK